MTFNDEPYRWRCPRGHVTVRKVGNSHHSRYETQGFRCATCRQYHGSAVIEYIVDAKTGTKKTP